MWPVQHYFRHTPLTRHSTRHDSWKNQPLESINYVTALVLYPVPDITLTTARSSTSLNYLTALVHSTAIASPTTSSTPHPLAFWLGIWRRICVQSYRFYDVEPVRLFAVLHYHHVASETQEQKTATQMKSSLVPYAWLFTKSYRVFYSLCFSGGGGGQGMDLNASMCSRT